MELKRLSLGLFLGLSFLLNDMVFAAASARANNPAKPNMNSITDNVDGPTVQTTSDGTKIIQNQDGSSVQIHPDGSLYIVNSDGSTIQKNTDGSEIDSKFN